MQHMLEKMKEEEEKLKKAQSTIAVMTMLKEGSVPDTIDTSCKNEIFSFHYIAGGWELGLGLYMYIII